MWFFAAAVAFVGGLLVWYCGTIGFWFGLPLFFVGLPYVIDPE